VAYVLLWLYLFTPSWGVLHPFAVLLTPVANLFGVVGGTTGWLVHPILAQLGVVLMLAWSIGEGFVLLMAARQSIPRDLYESAAMDGAGAWQRFRWVTLPALTPFLIYLSLRDTVLSFQYNFEAAVLLTKGGPYYATSYLPYWIYLNVVEFQRFGYAAAMTMVMLATTAAIILGQLLLVRRWRAAVST
jgi:multiple sugar transport system permease protein